MKTIEMRAWKPEVTNTPTENDLLVKGVAVELNELLNQGAGEGATSVLVGGDTLIFGAVDGDGEIKIYECTIRRANVDAVEDLTPTEPAEEKQKLH